MQLLGKGAGPGHAAHIRGHHYHILSPLAKLLGIVVNKDGVTQQVIHGDVKETLNLGGVQVHGQHPVGAGGGEHISHQLGRDRIAALGLAVLASIAKVRDHGSHAAGGGALAGVDHDEQFHQAIVHGLAGGVDEEHIAAADGLIQRDAGLAIGKVLDLCLTQLGADELADVLCQGGVGVAGEDLDVLAMRNHFVTHSLSFGFC